MIAATGRIVRRTTRHPRRKPNLPVTAARHLDSCWVTVPRGAPQTVDNVCCQHYPHAMHAITATNPPSTTANTTSLRDHSRRADPLGPDSLTWKYFGDLRTGMLGVWIGAIQNMYPELGACVEDHSIRLRGEPLAAGGPVGVPDHGRGLRRRARRADRRANQGLPQDHQGRRRRRPPLPRPQSRDFRTGRTRRSSC